MNHRQFVLAISLFFSIQAIAETKSANHGIEGVSETQTTQTTPTPPKPAPPAKVPVKEISSQSQLNEILKNATPGKKVLVKVGADYCPPCRRFDTDLPEITQTYSGSLSTIVKVESDSSLGSSIASSLGGTIPAFQLLKYNEKTKKWESEKMWVGYNEALLKAKLTPTAK